MDGAYDGKQNLDEINAALPLLCEGALVLFDNTIYVGDITDKMFAGRGEFAIPLLQESGFKIINYVYDGYNSQVLLRRM
jgi:predicted O-methyltransferase YrrM